MINFIGRRYSSLKDKKRNLLCLSPVIFSYIDFSRDTR